MIPNLDSIALAQHFDMVGAVIKLGFESIDSQKAALMGSILTFLISKFLEKAIETQNRMAHTYYRRNLTIYALEKALYLMLDG